jgi:subtilisin-like proprotein convertase family protein
MLVNLSLYLNISHTRVADLVVTLTNQNTGEKITVLDRPGIPNSQYGCSNNNIIAILDDAAAQPAEDKCAAYPAAISGIFLPNEALSSFSGRSVSGAWTLNVSDRSPNDTGRLNHWCLKSSLSQSMPPPTSTPTPVSLPSSAYVNGMSGQDQQLNLDCESRSAVDWAKHYGFNIDEIDFLNHLPGSDDPEVGFVGNPNGNWGNIPPDDYGVHARPVSLQLQEYGVTASSYRYLQWDDLRAEIADGSPVIVWIIGGSSFNLVNGIPYMYTAASTGDTTIVAPWEHTVILIGYTPTTVTVLNGSKFVEVPLDQFLDSWSVLQFMGVTARP